MIDRRLAKALVFLQALMIPVATLIAWVLKDIVVAKSVALGGLVLAGTLLFCLAIFSGCGSACFKASAFKYVSRHDGQVCYCDRWTDFDFKQCQTVVIGGIVLWFYSRSSHVVGCSFWVSRQQKRV
jgi:ATP synthase protein I